MNAEQIFHEAVEISDPKERAAFLNRACRKDEKLRIAIEALLQADEAAGDFLEFPAVEPNLTLDKITSIEGPGTKIGRYKLLELIGEGGMGLVYLAEQAEPVKRRVALKVIKPGMDSKEVIARFESERQALALLDHPNIAHVFDAGTTATGRPYFVMEYVKGMSIIRYCDEHKLSIEQRLKLFREVCEGVHHAHQKGIIHRDIKPSNILISLHGDRVVPKIIDFGIAKAAVSTLSEKTIFTFYGQLLGTPEYMSPEQVDLATQDIDTRSDIYSLGVVLYELLTGVLPFEIESLQKIGLAELQRTIRETEPASPSIRLTNLGQQAKAIADSRMTQVVPLARRLHRELEWIPLKAMRKDRCRRYKSASDMADDIQSYLNGNPLLAGPETAMYRVQKFVHKHAGSVVTMAIIALAIILGLVVSILMGCRAEQARKQEVTARRQVEQALIRAEQAEKNAKEQQSIAEQNAQELLHSLYVNSIQLADAKYREGNIGNARKLLESCPENLRGWEWDRINHVLDQSVITFVADKHWVWSVSVSPDGNSLVTGGGENTLKIWDITTGKEITELSKAHTGSINFVQFSSDGKHIVSGDSTGEIKIWDATNVSEPITSMRHGSSWIRSANFSPDDSQIVSISESSNEIKIWNVATGSEINTFGENPDMMYCTAFNPDGTQIVSGDETGIIMIRDANNGSEIMKLNAESMVLDVSFNSDGTLLASGSGDCMIKIWDVTIGSLVTTLRGHEGIIRSIEFSPDDKYLISGADDCKVKLWNVATGDEIMTLYGHQGSCDSVTFTPDGKQIVSGSWDGKIKVWNAILDHEVNRLIGHESEVSSIAFSPDGKRLVSHSSDGELKVWDVASTSEVITLKSVRVQRGVTSTAFSPDSKYIASLGVDCAVAIWDAESGAKVRALGEPEERARCMAFSLDGQSIVSGRSNGEITLWDVAKGEEKITWVDNGYSVLSVDISPDGKRIVSGHGTGDVFIWDAASGAKLAELKGHTGAVYCVAFSPDGKRIASACQQDCTAKIWDAVTGKELITLQGHAWYLYSVAFSPDGKRLVTGGWDRTARVWNPSTGEELLALPGDLNVNCVTFSPDGKSIAGGTIANNIMLWDTDRPADGYEPRTNAVTARNIVDQLHETHGLYHEVIDQLEADTTLDEPVRKVALQIANSRKIEDVEMLVKQGWEVVNSPDKDIDVYKSIVDKAQKVARSESKNYSILRTLGVGQYRIGAYNEALETLNNAEKIRTDNNLEPDPYNMAFIAMSQYKLDQVEDGTSVINTFRESLEDARFVDITSGKFSYLIEAEKVFGGTNEQLVTIWDLIDEKELDLAIEKFAEIEPSLEDSDSDFAFSIEGISRYLSRAVYSRGKSRLLQKDQDYIDRASDFESAIRIDPDYVSALKDLAWLKTTCKIEEVRDFIKAVDQARLACELTNWENHECLSVFAAACSENEQFAEAVKWQQKAIDLLPDEVQSEWASNYQERLRIYQSNLPYSAGTLWSFTEGKLLSFWDFNDVENGIVNNRIDGGSQVMLADEGHIVDDSERGSVLDLRQSSVECTMELDFDITAAISMSAWIKPDPSMEGWHVVFSKGEKDKGGRGWAISVNAAGTVTMSINVQNTLGTTRQYLPVSVSTDLMDGRWHHVVGTYDGEKACAYVDGKRGNESFIQGNITTNNGPVIIGDNAEWADQEYDWSWNGLIDDVRIYSYALSPEEVEMLHNGEEPPTTKNIIRD